MGEKKKKLEKAHEETVSSRETEVDQSKKVKERDQGLRWQSFRNWGWMRGMIRESDVQRYGESAECG